MTQTQPDQLHAVTPDDYTDDAQCPSCDSTNTTRNGQSCQDCAWSMPSLSTTEVTGDHKPVLRCDHCRSTMQIGEQCEHCLVERGLNTDDEADVNVVEDDDCIVIDNTESSQKTLDELLAESDIIDADDDSEVLSH